MEQKWKDYAAIGIQKEISKITAELALETSISKIGELSSQMHKYQTDLDILQADGFGNDKETVIEPKSSYEYHVHFGVNEYGKWTQRGMLLSLDYSLNSRHGVNKVTEHIKRYFHEPKDLNLLSWIELN